MGDGDDTNDRKPKEKARHDVGGTFERYVNGGDDVERGVASR